MRDILNCPNCGAPIEKSYCPYCGAVFLDWACFDVTRPTFVKIRDRRTGKINLMKLSLYSVDERIESEPMTLWGDNQRYITLQSQPDYTIEAEFKAVPFRHPLSDKEIFMIEIDENEASPELVKDVLKGFENN